VSGLYFEKTISNEGSQLHKLILYCLTIRQQTLNMTHLVHTTERYIKGGLGVVNLRAQNKALLLKNLDKFYNKRDIPWVNMIWHSHYANDQVPHASTDKGSFWWRDLLKLCDHFRGVATCQIGDGTTVLF